MARFQQTIAFRIVFGSCIDFFVENNSYLALMFVELDGLKVQIISN